MLFISFGFSISHVYCEKGEQWVFGAEMPTCKIIESDANCVLKQDDNGCKSKNERSKDTFDILFEYDGLTNVSNDFDCNKNLINFEHLDLYKIRRLLIISQKKECIHYVQSPPDLLKPDLVKLQTFII